MYVNVNSALVRHTFHGKNVGSVKVLVKVRIALVLEVSAFNS